jgi:hypothetical protein
MGAVPGVDVVAKRSQGWVKCVRTAFPTPKIWLLQLATCHDSATTTPRPAKTSVGAPGVQGPLEWGSWGFNAARGRCSGQLCSK